MGWAYIPIGVDDDGEALYDAIWEEDFDLPDWDSMEADNQAALDAWMQTPDYQFLTGGTGDGTTSGTTSGSTSGLTNLLKSLFTGTGTAGTATNPAGSTGLAPIIPLLGALLGASGAGKSSTTPSGYQGKIPNLTASRQQLPAATPPRAYGAPAQGQKHFTDVQYAAKGGTMGLSDGGFVIPADVVSHLGNGSSEAGLALLAQQIGATPIKGAGDGMSDSIDTHIDGNQPAKVANDEAYISPDKVSALGGGDAGKGAKKLYAMMDKIRQARTGTKKQGKQIDAGKFLPGGEVKGYADGGTTVPTGTTGTESNLSNWAGEYVTNMLGQGAALAEMPYQPYTGQLTAGTSPLSQTAYTQAQSWQTPSSVTDATNTLGQLAGTGTTPYSPNTFGTQFTAPAPYQNTDFTNSFTAPTGYQSSTFGNQYQAVAPVGATQFSNTFNAPDQGAETQFTNQFSAPGAYSPTMIGNQYQGTGAYTAGQFTNQFVAPELSDAVTQFTNQYQAPDAYNAANITTDKLSLAAAQQYMNPYLQLSLQPQIAEAQRQAQLLQMQNAAKATQAGAYGGSRQALMDTETQRNLGTNLAGIVGQGYNTAYTNATSQFNTDQARALQAQQATEQSRQFGASQAATAAQLQAQYGLSAQQAQEAARQFNSGQRMTAAQLQAQFGLSAQQAAEASRQFGANLGVQQAQNAAQYGMSAAQLNAQQQQFGAQQAMTAQQLQAQYGLSAQQAQEAARQFASGQKMTAAQLQAQYGMTAQQAQEAANQFQTSTGVQQAQNAATSGLAALQATEASRQFASGQQMTAAQLQAQYGMTAQQAAEASKQFGAQQGMTAAQMAAQYGLAGQQATEQSRQFGANYGLQGLQQQIAAAQAQGQLGLSSGSLGLQGISQLGQFGAQQQATEQASLDALRSQFEAERDNPYKMVQFQQSLLQGLPLSAQSYQTAQPSTLQEMLAGAAGITGLLGGSNTTSTNDMLSGIMAALGYGTGSTATAPATTTASPTPVATADATTPVTTADTSAPAPAIVAPSIAAPAPATTISDFNWSNWSNWSNWNMPNFSWDGYWG